MNAKIYIYVSGFKRSDRVYNFVNSPAEDNKLFFNQLGIYWAYFFFVPSTHYDVVQFISHLLMQTCTYLWHEHMLIYSLNCGFWSSFIFFQIWCVYNGTQSDPSFVSVKSMGSTENLWTVWYVIILCYFCQKG